MLGMRLLMGHVGGLRGNSSVIGAPATCDLE
jgi:hypothetical protein